MFVCKSKFKLAFLICFTALFAKNAIADNKYDFNADMLDLEDRDSIDLGKFSDSNYIMPGTYPFNVIVNTDMLPTVNITFSVDPSDVEKTVPCLNKKLINQFGLKPEFLEQITWDDNEQCAILTKLPGITVDSDLATSLIKIVIPKKYLEYRTETWDPPSLWSDGISGVILDYSVTAQQNNNHNLGQNSFRLSGNGVTGFNLSNWRFRADWQGYSNHTSRSGSSNSESDFKFSQIYAYTALPSLNSKLTLGESYLNSELFDSFRFTGASIASDVNMLPPNLRGYAPEVTGIATTNATVIISQLGRVIYQTQVPSGPFSIQDLPSGISGTLDVRVEEQNGNVQQFQVNTASIPYLSRPGMVRYSFNVGRPSNIDHKTEGDLFAMGEFSWGVSNGWSLFGGGIAGEKYNSLSVGIGRDLYDFGAISFDVTQSFADLNTGSKSGASYRINYSKRFDAISSQIQFAGYRFSEQDFLSMSDYLSIKNYGSITRNNKEMYTISFNKSFEQYNLSTYLNYNHQTYWNAKSSDRYDISASTYFDLGAIRNISTSISAYRNNSDYSHDSGFYLSLSIPLSNGGNLGYALSSDSGSITHQAAYYGMLNDKTSYNLTAGNARTGGMASAYASYAGSRTTMSANITQTNSYTSFGAGARGGITLTKEGGDIHRISGMGGTRMLIDTDGVSDIPIKGNGPVIKSNMFGKAILPGMNSYYRNRIKIDLNQLPDNAEVNDSVTRQSLTQGAIGYHKFNVLAGEKMMIDLKLTNGKYPAFGAEIINHSNQITGIVDDAGTAYISGIKPNEVMTVKWGTDQHCEIIFPNNLSELSSTPELLCK